MPWPLSLVATGDVITAAQLNQLPIALAKISGAGASIDFTSIPSYWTHLLVFASLQGGSGSNSDTLAVQFNGDTTAVYQWQRLRGASSTPDTSGNTAQTFINCGEVPGKSTGGFSSHFIIVPNYALVGRHEAVAYGHTSWDTSIATGQNVWVAGGTWYPGTAQAINRVTLSPAVGSFVAGSVVMLYGMGYF
jgi:hypothetical protein